MKLAIIPTSRQLEDDKIIAQALTILERRLKKPGVMLCSPDLVKQYLTLTMAELEHEVFTVLFLDSKNRLIASEEMFRGSLTSTSVYPREVVKAAILHNACSVMLAHCHPSGSTEPSPADLQLTNQLKKSLELVDVRTLDHVIVAGISTYSFAEHGQI